MKNHLFPMPLNYSYNSKTVLFKKKLFLVNIYRWAATHRET